MSAHLRVVAAALLAGAWLGLLLSGHAFGGAIHLLALGAVLVAPWRREPASGGAAEEPR
ncbi:MAG: hypothetical protein H6511_03780 [Holophagales bacterium]|nr:hypothetical protein [Holophagales bacterium]